jgi:tRNA dimethylallyltransferase
VNPIPIPLICISGPTATGKSAFAIALAKTLDGEIINADSVQVYRGLDIGSAKPSKKEVLEVPHHLISHVDPREHYSVGRFRREALQCIYDIHERKKIPIIVGGTGLYIRGLFSAFIDAWGFEFGEDVVSQISRMYSGDDRSTFLHSLLMALDREAARKFPQNDQVRVRRSLVQVISSGLPLEAMKKIRNASVVRDRRSLKEDVQYILCPLVWICEENRLKLYEKINQRVHTMINRGWVEEVGKLLQEIPKESSSMNSIGYKQLSSLDYSTFPELPEVPGNLILEIQRDTRRFAKRQMTWWRNQPNALDWKSIFGVCSFSTGLVERPSFEIHKVESCSDSSSEEQSASLNSLHAPLKDAVNGSREFCENRMKDISLRFISGIQSNEIPETGTHLGDEVVYFGRLQIV